MNTPGQAGHIPAHIKIRTTINDTRRVQIRVDEEAVGIVRLSLKTESADTSLIMGETAIRELAVRFADAVSRMDAHAADIARSVEAVA